MWLTQLEVKYYSILNLLIHHKIQFPVGTSGEKRSKTSESVIPAALSWQLKTGNNESLKGPMKCKCMLTCVDL